ncbi:MAG: ATP-binding cassette domain-containing protein, partial [Candidatus Eiseniibacteriota bacterium]
MSDGLRLSQVTAGYGETVVLSGVSLTLPLSGTLALLGRNGVGKSTLLATIMGHTTVHGGTIQLAGRDITAMPIHHRVYAGIGY